jgi:YD repeat-containing protein
MPYTKSPRPYKKEYELQKDRGEHERRMERQRARRKLDKELPDGNGNGKADAREGKDVAHRKALDKGGSNKNGTYITTASKNRSFKRDSEGNLVSETSTKERKKVVKKK